jgi:uncharacterized protein (DUF433 family)
MTLVFACAEGRGVPNRGILVAMRKRIVSDPEILSGTPCFRGTRIPLDHIAGLIRKGVSMNEITEDYPSLSEQDIAYARVFVRLVKPSPSSRAIKPIQLRRKTRAA